jgi:hypothetical protein
VIPKAKSTASDKSTPIDIFAPKEAHIFTNLPDPHHTSKIILF